MALTREVCSLKLVESQLLAAVASANGNADAAQSTIHHLGDELARCNRAERHCDLSVMGNHFRDFAKGRSVAELHAAAASKEAELFAVRSKLLEAQHDLQAKAAKQQQTDDVVEGLRRDLLCERESAARSLNTMREELAQEAGHERSALSTQAHLAKQKVAELTRRLQEQVCRSLASGFVLGSCMYILNFSEQYVRKKTNRPLHSSM
jgi:hypothetical protein